MAKLCERLVQDGYVRDDRQTELLDRSANLRAGRGFLTFDEIEERNNRQIEELLS